MARARPNVFTIPPGAPFARVLVAAVLDGTLGLPAMRDDPLALADLVIHVPTQRIRQALHLEFARALAPRAVLLPTIRALGEPADEHIPEAAEDLDPAAGKRLITPVERRFLLFPLVSRWLEDLHRSRAETEATPRDLDGPGALAARAAEAMRLTTALGTLIDEMAIEDVPLEALASAAPLAFDSSVHDQYWSETRDFLTLAAREWPGRLTTLGAEDQQARRLRLLRAEARRLSETPHGPPVIIAGSTGSVSATAELMRVISRLDRGAVVLPGLDLLLDDGADGAGWTAIGATSASLATRFAHPQASLKRTLQMIGIGRNDVAALGGESRARNRLISEAMRPAETTEKWIEERRKLDVVAATTGLTLINAPDERTEALGIAIAMRETLEKRGATVALVTADRAIARRVRAELLRWNIQAADSARGRLSEASLGLLARLFLKAEAKRTGANMLALLRHPLVRLDRDTAMARAIADGLELLVWRGRRFNASLPIEQQVMVALSAQDRPGIAASRVPTPVRQALPAAGKRLDAVLQQMRDGGEDTTLFSLASRLEASLIALTRDDTGVAGVEADPDWPEFTMLVAELAAFAGDLVLPVDAAEPILDMLIAERIARAATETHPRAMILGLLEARLVTTDRVILAGLAEGSLPPVAEADPFLNRAMRVAIGLQPPERRIGQNAHDVTMLCGHPDLILTFARRAGTQPGIPSRFLRRIEAFAGAEAWKEVTRRGDAYLALAEHLDRPEGRVAPIAAPAIIPCEPRIPDRISITEVETLRRDPYALYAKRLLKLEKLEPLDAEPDARDRGTALHQVLERYAAGSPPADAVEAEQRLRDLGQEAFRPFAASRELHHFWWQGFEAIIPAFVAIDRAARNAGRRILVEARADHLLRLPSGLTIRIVGKLDRIEVEPTGSAHILDFKSGALPTKKAVFSGLSPQLTISAALVKAGAVAELPEGAEIASVAYVPTGGKVAVEPSLREPEAETLDDVAGRHLAWLANELDALAAGRKPWRSQVAPQTRREAGDYDHLARVREWRVSGEAEEGDDAGNAQGEA